MDCSAAKIMNPTYRHAQPISCAGSHKQTQASRPFEEKKSSGTFQVPWIEIRFEIDWSARIKIGSWKLQPHFDTNPVTTKRAPPGDGGS